MSVLTKLGVVKTDLKLSCLLQDMFFFRFIRSHLNAYLIFSYFGEIEVMTESLMSLHKVTHGHSNLHRDCVRLVESLGLGTELI